MVGSATMGVGPLQVQAQTPRDEVACSRGKVRAKKVGVDFDLHDLGMAGGAEVGATKYGKRKAIVEEMCSFSDVGETLSGEVSGPKDYWAEFNKERRGLDSRA